MTSYNTFTDYASAQPSWLPGEMVEECFGKDAARAGNVQRTAAGWLIMDGNYRPATTLESAGIEAQMVKMAEALATFAGYDEIEALEITLAGYEQADEIDDLEAMILAGEADWLDYCDTIASARFGFALI